MAVRAFMLAKKRHVFKMADVARPSFFAAGGGGFTLFPTKHLDPSPPTNKKEEREEKAGLVDTRCVGNYSSQRRFQDYRAVQTSLKVF